MELMSPFDKDNREIRLCRLCGTDNKENIDIFSSKPLSSRCDDLLTKILTVYPLVLYKDDPLPQHICPKCIGNVSTTYQDIQQVLKQQNKWLSVTKAVQPEHKYFSVLNAVEKSTKATKESIKDSYNIEINDLPLKKLLAMPSRENLNTVTNNRVNKVNVHENVVKDIQTKLESNGFTIKRIKVPTTTEQNYAFNFSNESLDLTDSSEMECSTVSCNYCQQKFSNLKVLAQHQLIHLNVTANKIFEKRLLHKSLRRGRLITINDSKCIRCLNCWRIFKDNKAILQHWSGGECEFFCCICGKEFAHSPKLLREHVPNEHGISYRSSISCGHSHRTRTLPSTELIYKTSPLLSLPKTITTSIAKKVNKYKKPSKTCIKNDDGTLTCRMCHKTFTNFRSCNSHMRKHKPTIRYGDQVFASSKKSDNYNTQDDYTALQPSTSYHLYGTNNTSYPSTENYFHMKYPRPAYRVFHKNDHLRGIRTKIVEKRHDFLTNSGINSHSSSHHRQIPLASNVDKNIPDNDDDTLIIPELTPTFIKKEPVPHNEGENSGADSMEHSDYGNSSLEPIIKSEPIDRTEEMGTSETSVCFICNEQFTSSQEYNLHAMFVHNIN